MSHFTVLVIGDNVDEQLAPYDENLEVDPYKEVEAASAKAFWATARLQGLGVLGPDPTAEEVVAAYLNEWHEGGGDEPLFVEDGKIMHWSTYSPNSKWDWYMIGGRWSGFFALKEGADEKWATLVRPGDPGAESPFLRSDQAPKGQIDFDGMRAEALVKAAVKHAAVREAVEGIALPTESLDSLRTREIGLIAQACGHDGVASMDALTAEDLEQADERARRLYYQHPWRVAARESGGLWLSDPFEEFCFDTPDPEAEYLRRRAAAVGRTFAVVKDGVWYEQGQMGWFAVATDEKDESAWDDQVRLLLDGLPDDTLLTLVDAHI